MSWTRYEGRAFAHPNVEAGALHAELEDRIRAVNPNLTDVRLERATEAQGVDAAPRGAGRWYDVTYVADDGEGY